MLHAHRNLISIFSKRLTRLWKTEPFRVRGKSGWLMAGGSVVTTGKSAGADKNVAEVSDPDPSCTAGCRAVEPMRVMGLMTDRLASGHMRMRAAGVRPAVAASGAWVY